MLFRSIIAPIAAQKWTVNNMEHILFLSYGKDSLACLGAIEQLGLPLDRIIHAEIWATDTIPADLPPMVEFKAKADKIIKERYGIIVEHICCTNIDGVKKDKATYQDGFYHFLTSGKYKGTIKGFPMQRGPWCQKLKARTFDKFLNKSNEVRYLGIAYDEPKRFKILSDCIKSPLVTAQWTEQQCYDWCSENDLLSPIYETSMRGGCWFCHNQPLEQLRLLRKNYPDLWAILLKWDNDSPVTFKSDGRTVHDFDKRFALEDEGILLPNDRTFKWDCLDGDIQLKFY